MSSPKWKLKHLTKQLSLKEASGIILRARIRQLKKKSSTFLSTDAAGDLHAVRIALRRVRYAMELFFDCYDKKKFLRLYSKIEYLQNASGAVRDNFMMQQNISLLQDEQNNSTAENLKSQAAEKEKRLNTQFKDTLTDFLLSNELKDFTKLVR